MTQNALIQVRVEAELKQGADELFSDLGFDTPTAVRIFLKHAVKCHGLPFAVGRSMPNAETMAAMEEADRISHDPDVRSYTDVDAMMKELLADV